MSRELEAMRHMAWERAKGELLSMLHTYYSEPDRKTGQRDTTEYDAMHTKVWGFIGEVKANQ